MIEHTRKAINKMRDDKLREWLAEKVREDSLFGLDEEGLGALIEILY